MDIKEILVEDTGGQLTEDLFKINQNEGVAKVWYNNKESKSPLLATVNNIRFSSIPGVEGSTYKMFLTYNGSAGRIGKVYSTVVAETQGIFNSTQVPVLEFSSGEFYDSYVNSTENHEEVVFDLGQFRKCEVLQYDKTCCDGSTSRTMYTREYSVPLETFPNATKTTVYTDGWYTLTFIILRDLENGGRVNKGLYYGFNGFIFRASDDGIFAGQEFTNCGGNSPVYDKTDQDCTGCGDCENQEGDVEMPNSNAAIIVDGTGDIVPQTYNDNYLDILFDLNNSAGKGAHAGTVYAQAQILVSIDLLAGMINEVSRFSDDHCGGGCDFADWQMLMLKGISARVMFQNGAYSKAQTLIEGTRELCGCNGNNGINC